jgi:hypothetical protein
MGEVDKSKSLIVKIVSKWYDAGVLWPIGFKLMSCVKLIMIHMIASIDIIQLSLEIQVSMISS